MGKKKDPTTPTECVEGFDLAPPRPDYDYYASLDAWTSSEAAALLCGYDPEIAQTLRLNNWPKASDVYAKMAKLLNSAADSGGIKLLPAVLFQGHRIRPLDVLEWAKQKGIELPGELIAAIASSEADLQLNTKRPRQAEYNARQREEIYRIALAALIRNPDSFRKKNGAFNGNALAAYLETAAVHVCQDSGGRMPLASRTIQDLLRQVVKEAEKADWPDPGPAKNRSQRRS